MNEVTWQKSSYCAEGNNCVEIGGGMDGHVVVRESTEGERVLHASRERFGVLLAAVRQGRLDLQL
ncbi:MULTISPECIES: DUF397 domain-containing protein [unclassified Streptomyces]|uniref:DUF397 domain-containing protein n=1 Tax=unclassified Streptomyces TaxID=2593676 RepID=UPI0022B74EFB|nr:MULTISPECIES: DUF397 domain-containing protein [unclassified Streptomyces]MCZ7417139.1 DUF397 domain-containing protein [Streptomyces sp. WMMC897]MCZ7433032.1 DUF397 domain-containing protein [Streptomyces sp. WMMC1477]